MSTGKAPWVFVDRDDLSPVCPHCEDTLEQVYRRATGFPIGQGRTVVYFCPHCHKTLGIAHGLAI